MPVSDHPLRLYNVIYGGLAKHDPQFFAESSYLLISNFGVSESRLNAACASVDVEIARGRKITVCKEMVHQRHKTSVSAKYKLGILHDGASKIPVVYSAFALMAKMLDAVLSHEDVCLFALNTSYSGTSSSYTKDGDFDYTINTTWWGFTDSDTWKFMDKELRRCRHKEPFVFDARRYAVPVTSTQLSISRLSCKEFTKLVAGYASLTPNSEVRAKLTKMEAAM